MLGNSGLYEDDFKAIDFKGSEIRFKASKNSSSAKQCKSRPPIAFPNLFGEKTSNQDIFNQTLSTKIDESFEGKNLTVLTYGISGSGKTHTIFGLSHDRLNQKPDQPMNNFELGSDRGLIDLAMTQIFEKSQSLTK